MNYTQKRFAQNINCEFLMILFVFIFPRDHMERDKREMECNHHQLFHGSFIKFIFASLLGSISPLFLDHEIFQYLYAHGCWHVLKKGENNIFIHLQYRKQFYRLFSESEQRRWYCQIPRGKLTLEALRRNVDIWIIEHVGSPHSFPMVWTTGSIDSMVSRRESISKSV